MLCERERAREIHSRKISRVDRSVNAPLLETENIGPAPVFGLGGIVGGEGGDKRKV